MLSLAEKLVSTRGLVVNVNGSLTRGFPRRGGRERKGKIVEKSIFDDQMVPS